LGITPAEIGITNAEAGQADGLPHILIHGQEVRAGIL
jgi:hypothetical protein